MESNSGISRLARVDIPPHDEVIEGNQLIRSSPKRAQELVEFHQCRDGGRKGLDLIVTGRWKVICSAPLIISSLETKAEPFHNSHKLMRYCAILSRNI